MTDRDAQVRRLAEAITSSERALPKHWSGWLELAGVLFDAGARMPEPAPPKLPVVGIDALEAARDGQMRSGWTASLRAAWPFLVRDTVNALPQTNVFDIPAAPRVWIGNVPVPVPDLIRALGGAA